MQFMSSDIRPYFRGVGLAMSSFQSINKPKSTSVMAYNSSDPSDVSVTGPATLVALEECVSTLMQRSSSQEKPCSKKNRVSPMVVVPAMSLQASTSSELSQNLQKPSKKRNAINVTPKALREQPLRAVKLMPTIEHSATPSFADNTPTKTAGVESDSNWSLASTHLGELESDLSPGTSHRRKSHRQVSSTAFTESASTKARKTSPSHQENSGKAVKREGTPSLDRSVIRLRSPSPLSYSKEVREKKLQEEDIVELPPVEWAHQRFLRVEKAKNFMERLWMEEVRKQKGKEPEHAAQEKEALTPYKVPNKRKVKADQETSNALKRQKQSCQRVNEEMHAGLQPAQTAASKKEHPPLNSRGDKREEDVLLGKLPKVMMDKGSGWKAVNAQTASEVLPCKVAKASENSNTKPKVSEEKVPLQRSTATGCIPTGPKALQAKPMQGPRSGQNANDRREVEFAASHPGRCKCKNLPDYFKQVRLLEPSLADSGRGVAEFLAHVRQVSDCKGHNQRLIDTCRLISTQEQGCQMRKATNSSASYGQEDNDGNNDAIYCAGDWLLSSRYAAPSLDTYAICNRVIPRHEGLSSEHISRIRQMSSIDPTSFYGKQPKDGVPPNIESSSSITDEALINESNHTEKDLVTPPDSSPVNEGSNKRRTPKSALVPFEIHMVDDWRPMFDIDDPMFLTPESSRPDQNEGSSDSSNNNNDDASPSQSNRSVMDVGLKSRPQSFREGHALPVVPDERVGQRRSAKVLKSSKDGPHPPRSFSAQRRRHRSVPTSSVSRTGVTNGKDESPQALKSGRGRALQEISHNAILLGIGGMKKEVASLKKMVLERFPATPMTQSGPVRPPTAPTAAAVTDNGNERPQRKRKNGPSDPEWERKHPQLDRNVPRLPDEEVIEIGRTIINAYQRHVRAPGAFSRRGRLYKGRNGYKHLLNKVDENGETVWDSDEIARMQG